MNVVIPMAGSGKRFVDAGYDRPKPFIDVDHNTPMIQLVLLNLIPRQIGGNYHFILLCLSDFVSMYGVELDARLKMIFESARNDHIKLSYEIMEVNYNTEGAACTVLLAKDKINNDEELMIANCDQLVLDRQVIDGSLEYYRERNVDGGILCFLAESPKWSYCRMSGERITEVVEKQVVSNLATVGIYYYRQGRMFVDAAEAMIGRQFKVNGEFYLAPAFNDMIVKDMKIVPYLVNDMVGLGTPEDLREHQKRIWQKC